MHAVRIIGAGDGLVVGVCVGEFQGGSAQPRARAPSTEHRHTSSSQTHQT